MAAPAVIVPVAGTEGGLFLALSSVESITALPSSLPGVYPVRFRTTGTREYFGYFPDEQSRATFISDWVESLGGTIRKLDVEEVAFE